MRVGLAKTSVASLAVGLLVGASAAGCGIDPGGASDGAGSSAGDTPECRADGDCAGNEVCFAGDCEPATLVIYLNDAIIGPGNKTEGAQWDGPGDVSPEVWEAVNTALLGPNPFNDVLAYFETAAVQALGRPDPFGYAEIAAGGGYDYPIELWSIADNYEDTLTPAFPPNSGWVGVPLSDGLRIRVHLDDEDLANNDPIGTAEITAADIVAALRAGDVHHVNVAGDTNDAILFISISVFAE